jgi:head-tail adaptor
MAETIRLSKYRYRLTFQEKTLTADTFGGFTEAWTDAFTIWGDYAPQKSDLLHTADKRFAERIATFTVPYPPDQIIDPTKHRIAIEENPKAAPGVLSFWDIYPPLQKDGRYRELEIKARQYQ